jgi:acetyltransferase-like isoleucine patch superfamily enzyme
MNARPDPRDAYKKYEFKTPRLRTVIEADVHVGSNCVLVAPVTIGQGGTVGGLDHHQEHAGR